jgi:hypothetical protein
MNARLSLLPLAAAAALASTGLASAAGTTPQVKVHAIFGGTGAHVGQVLDVRTSGHTSSKVTEICWAPAPIDRPACSPSVNGAPSAVGTTKLTLKLQDGTQLTKSIKVTAPYRHRGGRGGSDAAPGHVTCAKLKLYGNPGAKGLRATLASGARVAQYNQYKNHIFYWDYATNENGFGKRGCVSDGLGAAAPAA